LIPAKVYASLVAKLFTRESKVVLTAEDELKLSEYFFVIVPVNRMKLPAIAMPPLYELNAEPETTTGEEDVKDKIVITLSLYALVVGYDDGIPVGCLDG
jgi:hypothetical protein